MGSVQSETFKVMERRLLRVIINPAMIATWILGLWLAWHGPDSHYGWFNFGWLQAKLAIVILLSAVHGLSKRPIGAPRPHLVPEIRGSCRERIML